MTGTEPSLIREWSRKAGCSPCPCSSSYHPGPRKCPHLLLTSSWRLWLALTCPAFSVWTWKSLSTELNLGQQSHSLHCGHRTGPMLSSPPPPIPLLGPFSIHPSRGFNVDHPNSGRAPLKTSILHRLCDFSVTPLHGSCSREPVLVGSPLVCPDPPISQVLLSSPAPSCPQSV